VARSASGGRLVVVRPRERELQVSLSVDDVAPPARARSPSTRATFASNTAGATESITTGMLDDVVGQWCGRRRGARQELERVVTLPGEGLVADDQLAGRGLNGRQAPGRRR
jgi:hypothetical protein